MSVAIAFAVPVQTLSVFTQVTQSEARFTMSQLVTVHGGFDSPGRRDVVRAPEEWAWAARLSSPGEKAVAAVEGAIFGAGIHADEPVAALCSGLGKAAIELSLELGATSRYWQGWDLDEAATWAVERLNMRGAVGSLVLFDAERDVVAIAHRATDFPVATHSGDGPSPWRRSGCLG